MVPIVGLILCAGKGTRLKEETKDKPKCMVSVGGKPVLEHIADHMNKHGIWRIVVNLHLFPDVVMKHFGQRFMYLYEPVPMGEFGTVSMVRPWLDDHELLFVMNGDTLTDIDLSKLSAGRYHVDGIHMGTTVMRRGELLTNKKVNCWYQDIGTPEGLKKARDHYEKFNNL